MKTLVVLLPLLALAVGQINLAQQGSVADAGFGGTAVASGAADATGGIVALKERKFQRHFDVPW